MKKLIAILLIILLFGCTQEPVAEQEVSEEPMQEDLPLEAEIIEPPEEPLAQEITALFARNSKITSYEYIYKGDSPQTITYYIKGEKIWASYPQVQEYGGFEFYDVYMDSKIATLICADVDKCKGKKAKEAPLSKFVPITPLEIISQISNGEITETTQIENRDTSVVSYTNADGNQERIWIWDYWGIPVKREITKTDSKEVIAYDNLVVNSVKDEQVTLPDDLEMQ